MPAAQNSTVKKVDGTTDVVYAALQGAGGTDPIILRQDSGQPSELPTGLRPLIRGWQKTDGKDGRVISMRMDYPYAVLNSTTGRYERIGVVPATFTVTLPANVPPPVQAEAVYQFIHMLNSSSTAAPGKAAIATGFLPS